MDLTTLARVRTLLTSGGNQLPAAGPADTALTELIKDVSAAVEFALGMRCKKEARTEYHDIRPGGRILWLKGWPIDTAQPLAVYSDSLRAFDATSSLVPASDYYVDAEDGTVEFTEFIPAEGSGVIKVTYTGGMAADAAGLITANPDLVRIVDRQVVACWRARTNPAGTKAARPQRGGGSSAPQEEPGMELVPPMTLLRPFLRHRL